MIPLLCAICPKIPSDQWLSTQFQLLFDLIEPFGIITVHAGYKEAILNLLLLVLQQVGVNMACFVGS